ncbi:hypothetical protein S3E15_04620 [Bacillus mycoides]|uniref:Uncharacterized protein n=1 Tax=Bacillus mycoides TaxID=1405 RepID=A0AAP7W9D4_BACMY|nr:hypothetical protein M2E15_1312 [Bacillus mycoides]KZD45626.1 hypothetical protein B4083_0320 [Bacillus cereus]KZE04389.1 hypothetical protein B4117_4090 [Bacillus mycoides]OSX87686.1 hypothetical protein BTJ44_03363 [Bacillus mycoides]OSX93461.1 hypothetical protein S3E15_04620 [Bacillus mycoides]
MFQFGFIMMKDIQCGATCKEFIFRKKGMFVSYKEIRKNRIQGGVII